MGSAVTRHFFGLLHAVLNLYFTRNCTGRQWTDTELINLMWYVMSWKNAPLSPWHGASSSCRWVRQPSDTDGVGGEPRGCSIKHSPRVLWHDLTTGKKQWRIWWYKNGRYRNVVWIINSIRQTQLCLFINYCWIGYMFRPCRVIIRPLREPSNVRKLRTSLGSQWCLQKMNVMVRVLRHDLWDPNDVYKRWM